MISQVIKEGDKNFSLVVRGFVTSEQRVPVVDLKDLKTPHNGWKGLRLDSVAWLIQEKAGLLLWWEDDDSEENFVLPMESRNFLRFDEGFASPRLKDGWKGKIWMSAYGLDREPKDERKAFFVIMDFDKQ